MLKKLLINNFLSFDKSLFEFNKINCLIAPNNTGKSNLIKVFEFLNVALYENIDFAISMFGGYEKLKNYRLNSDKIEIEATYELKDRALINYDFIDYKMTLVINIQIDTKEKKSNIDMLIEGAIKGTNIFETERLNLIHNRIFGNNIEKYITTYEQSLEKLSSKRYSYFIFAYSLNTLGYTLHDLNNEKSRYLFNLFNMQFNTKNELVKPLDFNNIFNNKRIFSSFYFVPYIMKSTQQFHTKFLDKTGINLAYYLSSLDKDIFEDISLSLIGEVEVINGIKIEDEETKKLYFIEEINQIKERLISITDVSDGTLHFIAIMTALIGTNYSMGIAIEEPERHMHMKVLSYILNTMRDDNKQIFFTTHSGEMLKELNQDEIIFLYRDEDTNNTKSLNALKIKSLKKVFETNKYDISEIITNEVLGYIGDYNV